MMKTFTTYINLKYTISRITTFKKAKLNSSGGGETNEH